MSIQQTDRLLPIKPFKEWLEKREKYYGSRAKLVSVIGLHKEKVDQIMNGEITEYSEVKMDKAFIRDDTTTLEEIYPYDG